MFTVENTEGFTKEDLEVLNNVYAELTGELDKDYLYSEDECKNIRDKISNAWLKDGDNDEETLCKRARGLD